jgi:hypothetical protein
MDSQITAAADRAPSVLSVHVLATTPEGTRSALMSARRLSERLGARIVLLVPRPKALSDPLDPASDERNAIVEEYRAIASSVDAPVNVLLCVCQRVEEVVHHMLSRTSLLIVGGQGRRWWPSREQRLARHLTAQGYSVVFAQVGADHVIARLPAMAS